MILELWCVSIHSLAAEYQRDRHWRALRTQGRDDLQVADLLDANLGSKMRLPVSVSQSVFRWLFYKPKWDLRLAIVDRFSRYGLSQLKWVVDCARLITILASISESKRRVQVGVQVYTRIPWKQERTDNLLEAFALFHQTWQVLYIVGEKSRRLTFIWKAFCRSNTET